MLKIPQLKKEFFDLLKIEAPQNSRLLDAAQLFLEAMQVAPVAREERKIRLFQAINSKFDVNGDVIAHLLSSLANKKITLNYHQKIRLSEAFDRIDKSLFLNVLNEKTNGDEWAEFFLPSSNEQTLEILHKQLEEPTLTRKDSKPRDWSNEIKEALFASFVFCAFPEKDAHGFFDFDNRDEYYPDFWDALHNQKTDVFSRDRTLVYLKITPYITSKKLSAAIEREYVALSNHGHLALHFSDFGDKNIWTLWASSILFAEKFKPSRVLNSYFKHKFIEEITRNYIPACCHDGNFELAHLGFQYKDTFVIEGDNNPDLVVIFQKNISDETIIPCPACRSTQVQGNSYSSLGVKSWECNNPICPDKSKYNRGKRYSFLQLLKQQGIERPENLIPLSSVKAWSRDVQPKAMKEQIIPMLIQHYSLAKDGVKIINGDCQDTLGRRVEHVASKDYFFGSNESIVSRLQSSSYFKRFSVIDEKITANDAERKYKQHGLTALLGDSAYIMRGLPENSIEGAVTSPPYYNAREYSQWPNIYCYLFDMFNNARMVFRVLKPGGYYLFNIFDYFDNENNLALSAMGEKRMILSSYCIFLFEQAGFSCEGNVVWDKGEIEGKRAFNGGNFSPYYQAPFNCWEHILLFRKPGSSVNITAPFPKIVKEKPVMKMVRGENRYGHTAPFPEFLPSLLASRLPKGSTILDPYAGSMTTARAAYHFGQNSICIEKDMGYFELGIEMFLDNLNQSDLAQAS